jgi:hypothetical protein
VQEPDGSSVATATGGEPAGRSREELASWLLGPAFVVLAAILLVATPVAETPAAPTPPVEDGQLEVRPRRTVLTDPPTVVIAGFEQRCNACHKLFESRDDIQRPLEQHKHIRLGHGINNECNNCHARDNRERLVLHDGTDVPYAEVEQLCSQCHGPVFRDWRRGAHGKTLGAWDLSSDRSRKLTCTECHDPHRPAYDPIAPLPGPNTLRLGETVPTGDEHAGRDRNPLRHWIDNAPADGGHE